ncbi:(4Fe-4S)-binding protein [Pedobacter psychrodurus]|nr:(4Fe-4S)-binding protein [Pedobacter psychrodurus]
MEKIEYFNEEISILWQPKVCIHAGICVKTLPKVYDPTKRPWIKIENATTEQLFSQIAKCPSGALSIEKTDKTNSIEMEQTKVVIDRSPYGEIQLFSDDVKAGKMDIAISGEKLTVFHTEVRSEFAGRGFAKLLLDKLVNYAEQNSLKIVPVCPYVNLQFRRHPKMYAAVWYRE